MRATGRPFWANFMANALLVICVAVAIGLYLQWGVFASKPSDRGFGLGVHLASQWLAAAVMLSLAFRVFFNAERRARYSGLNTLFWIVSALVISFTVLSTWEDLPHRGAIQLTDALRGFGAAFGPVAVLTLFGFAVERARRQFANRRAVPGA
jgi:hypothetical protein